MFYSIMIYIIPSSIGSALSTVGKTLSAQAAGVRSTIDVPQLPVQYIFQNIASLALTFDNSALNSDLQNFIYIIQFVGTYFSFIFVICIALVIIKFREFNRQQRVKEAHEEAMAIAAALAPGGAWFGMTIDGLPSGLAGEEGKVKNVQGSAGIASNPISIISAISSIFAGGGHKTDNAMVDVSGKATVPVANTSDASSTNFAAVSTANSAPTSNDASIATSAAKIVHAKKWQRIIDHASSDNPNDWRQSILEADVLLDDMLDEMTGHAGGSLGDRLKSMTTTEMPSLQLAWEAHLVRNQIAHEGADFSLSQREARRVISLYEHVLRQGMYF